MAKTQLTIEQIMEKLPDTITPAILDKSFMLLDGGKTVRRHLRAKFANNTKHQFNDKWAFAKNTDTAKSVIEYFMTRYEFNPTFDKLLKKSN